MNVKIIPMEKHNAISGKPRTRIQLICFDLEMRLAELGELLEESPAAWTTDDCQLQHKSLKEIDALNRQLESMSPGAKLIQKVVNAIDELIIQWPCSPDVAVRDFMRTIDDPDFYREFKDLYEVELERLVDAFTQRIEQIDEAICAVGFGFAILAKRMQSNPPDWTLIERATLCMATFNSTLSGTADPLLCRLSAAATKFVCSLRTDFAKASEALEAELNVMQPQMMQQFGIAIPGSIIHGGDIYCEIAEDDGTITSLK